MRLRDPAGPKILKHLGLDESSTTHNRSPPKATIDDAVANRHRPEADSKRDSLRKPAEVLRFFGIEEGMSVFDIFAGGGYYSELLSYVVGPTGSVTMYNNKPWDDFVGSEVRTRLANDRLPNIPLTVAKPESLVDQMEKFDVAIFVLGMHDIYYAHPEDGWPAIDRQVFLRGIFSLVKDGGVLAIPPCAVCTPG